MRFISVYTVLLTQALTALCQNDYPYQAPLSCEERASLQGLPTDGWTIVYYDGQPTCRRVSVGEFAFCDGTEYTDADTKVKGCCSGASELTWMNEQDKLAKCRPKDHGRPYDEGVGPACPTGSRMQDGRCIQETRNDNASHNDRDRRSQCTNHCMERNKAFWSAPASRCKRRS
ncbi:hypothetical protein AZE42_03558 [Rhizopogon vesiculosus]|uniref:Uncharacterized protein n=1 Tax=Rhizopogon vesiculosus TaxID=180088 RepID=A0A1J8QAN4_9AGAM|nr:hypothetical protein AZE42_03558 [Rhizopogon vesiculosus]